jgi:hypothetical protein
MTERVGLDDELHLEPLALAQLRQPVEDALPIPVAREIAVGDEEVRDPLRQVAPDDLLDVVGRATARLAALHVDDGAEGALEGAAAAGIEARRAPSDALDAACRQHRRRHAGDARQVVHVVVEGTERPRPGVAQYLVEPSSRLAGKERDTERHRLLELRRQLGQHRQRARHVKAADANLDAARAQQARDIHGAGELVRLHAHQPDEPALDFADRAGDALRLDASVGLVEHGDDDVDIGTQHAALGAVAGETIKIGERRRRDRRAQPLDDVAVIVVMRRLDQNQRKATRSP